MSKVRACRSEGSLQQSGLFLYFAVLGFELSFQAWCQASLPVVPCCSMAWGIPPMDYLFSPSSLGVFGELKRLALPMLASSPLMLGYRESTYQG